jgi:hypothetical protein
LATKKLVRKLSRANLAAFSQAAASVDWMTIANSADSVDECAHSLQHSIQQLVDFYFPLRVIRIRSNEPPWMKPSLKLLISRRDKAFDQKKRLKYLRLRDDVISHEKFLKTLHLQEATMSKNPKDFWNSVNSIARRPKVKQSEVNISAEDFSSYFESVFQTPSADETPEASQDLPHHALVLSTQEVESQLLKIKPKSSGPDGIPFWVLRSLATLLSPSITSVFNRSLAEGRVPRCFKIADVRPIPKTTNAKLVSQFRPISLLPLLSKTLERLVVKKWITPHLQTIDNSQFAYLSQPGSGTTCATTSMYLNILRHLDQASGAVRVLSVDFAKAFDKLPHKVILSTITDLKLPVEAVSWIKDFLSERFQRVSINNSSSKWCSVPSGVPQGSVLGPHLFCAVIASLHPVCSNTRFIKYADDVTALHFLRETEDDSLQLEFDHIRRWSQKVGLPLNTSKSAVMDIVTKTTIHPKPLADDEGAILPSVTSIKTLGVTFTNNLRWDEHCKDVHKRASKRIFAIRNLKRSGCDIQSMLKVYRQTIQSLLSYCHPCCCNMSQSCLDTLTKVETRCLRVILRNCSNQRLSHFVPLSTAIFNSCDRLFKNVLHQNDHRLRIFFDQRKKTPRNNSTLKKPKCRTARFKNSFIKFCR